MQFLTRELRRLDRLAGLVPTKTGEERALILKTIMKILDECSDAEYDAAWDSKQISDKLTAAGITLDDEWVIPCPDQ